MIHPRIQAVQYVVRTTSGYYLLFVAKKASKRATEHFDFTQQKKEINRSNGNAHTGTCIHTKGRREEEERALPPVLWYY